MVNGLVHALCGVEVTPAKAEALLTDALRTCVGSLGTCKQKVAGCRRSDSHRMHPWQVEPPGFHVARSWLKAG